MLKTLVVSYCFLFLLVPFSGAAATDSRENIEQSQDKVEKGRVHNGISNSEAYRLLYENSKLSNDRLLTTLHWSLGFGSTLFLALVGSQIFFNFRIKKEELSNIRSAMEEEILEQKVDMLNEIRTLSKKSGVESRSFKEKFKEEMIALIVRDKMEIEKKQEKFEENIKSLINSGVEEKSKLVEIINQLNESRIDNLKLEIDAKIRRLNIQLEKAIGDIWGLRGVRANALSRFIETVKMEISEGIETKYTLDEIISCLEELDEIDDRCYDGLIELEKKLTEEKNDYKVTINDIISEMPVYSLDTKVDGSLLKKYIKNNPA